MKPQRIPAFSPTAGGGDSPPVLPVEAGYDRWSEVYDDDGNPLTALEEPVVRAWLSDIGGKVVADVGCGTGRHAAWLAAAGARVVAFDVSSGMLRRARELCSGQRVLFCRHRLPDPLPIADEGGDALLCALVGEHLTDLPAAMKEFARVLRPGGTMVFTALHPAMNLLGISARFWDPRTGAEVRVQAYAYRIADYINAALAAGLALAEMVERSVDEELARVRPRAAKYLGWPMLLALRFRSGYQAGEDESAGSVRIHRSRKATPIAAT